MYNRHTDTHQFPSIHPVVADDGVGEDTQLAAGLSNGRRSARAMPDTDICERMHCAGSCGQQRVR